MAKGGDAIHFFVISTLAFGAVLPYVIMVLTSVSFGWRSYATMVPLSIIFLVLIVIYVKDIKRSDLDTKVFFKRWNDSHSTDIAQFQCRNVAAD